MSFTAEERTHTQAENADQSDLTSSLRDSGRSSLDRAHGLGLRLKGTLQRLWNRR
jgi:hypothetical protein